MHVVLGMQLVAEGAAAAEIAGAVGVAVEATGDSNMTKADFSHGRSSEVAEWISVTVESGSSISAVVARAVGAAVEAAAMRQKR